MRKKEFYDGSIPSGNSVVACTILRLGRIFGKPEWVNYAAKTLQSMAEHILKAPIGYTFALIALDLLVNGSKTVYIVPAKGDKEYLNLLRWINKNFLPDVDYVAVTERLRELSDFLKNLKGDKETLYYLCRNFACEPSKKIGKR